MTRSKELNRDERGQLNLLLLRQAYLVRKLSSEADSLQRLSELRTVQSLIQAWYSRQCEKVQIQSRCDEFQESEQTRIYHHELHKRKLKKCSILKLQTQDGLLEGHDQCAGYLESLASYIRNAGMYWAML